MDLNVSKYSIDNCSIENMSQDEKILPTRSLPYVKLLVDFAHVFGQ